MVNGCFICGDSPATFPKKDAIKPSFTNYSDCVDTMSDYVCNRCYQCLNGRYQQCWYYHPTKQKWSKLWGRNWSWIVSPAINLPVFEEENKGDGLLVVKNLPTRKELKDFLVNPIPPFRVAIAVSGQKHTYPFARLNVDTNKFWVRFEAETIFVKSQDFEYTLKMIEKALNLGIKKTELLTGQYNPISLTKIATSVDIVKLFSQIDNVRKMDIFALALHVAQSDSS